ncbi:hypothetical protein HOP50_03g24260 [Chloropicon primus]|uniref:Transport and Golgi organization protein n=1 Tax=Chloropicon primus TaxID=1764295 RepID=A0A5B8MHI7_9CHLO|nr:hypothetical protein A3770_03p24270 [Chloropicon primus]UPQ99120.1 hypothetical protein HOP50_03g24260 [Chloropicon primus]|mmetsp:Transcript_6779/g.19840  ORF Transcript_6779/g.19840 Transcript_6779/m.19840 type:complete len:312 (+) Transcript_6779:175-1110(+)|eukprot:QDZ19909.1 hypothetical protein A3770_03p24270 [Chloropicon primus]
MCVTFVLVDSCGKTVVAFNRDEFLDRATAAPHWWDLEDEGLGEDVRVFGGRDLRAAGSWFGVSKSGRIAFLTNFREVEEAEEHGNRDEGEHDEAGGGPSAFFRLGKVNATKKSRGALVKDYLTGKDSPAGYCKKVRQEDYSGYNLVVGDLTTSDFAHVSNRKCSGVSPLERGKALGTSNGQFGAWWKVRRGCSMLEEGFPSRAASKDWAKEVSDWMFGTVLLDGQKAPKEELPQTGFGDDIETLNSSIYVRPFKRGPVGEFGTRSSTVVLFHHEDRTVHWYEKTFLHGEEDGERSISLHKETFKVEGPGLL